MEEVCPQNFTVELPKNNTSELQFQKFSTPSTFSDRRTTFQTEVCSGSNHPSEAMRWIEEVEMANTVGDLKTSQYLSGRVCPNFETLDARNATSLKKIILNLNLKKKVHLEEKKAQKED